MRSNETAFGPCTHRYTNRLQAAAPALIDSAVAPCDWSGLQVQCESSFRLLVIRSTPRLCVGI